MRIRHYYFDSFALVCGCEMELPVGAWVLGVDFDGAGVFLVALVDDLESRMETRAFWLVDKNDEFFPAKRIKFISSFVKSTLYGDINKYLFEGVDNDVSSLREIGQGSVEQTPL